MRDKPVARISEAIAGYLAKSGLKQRVEQASVVSDWAELVGPQLARVTQPDAIARDGTLFVRVSSAAWMQELQLLGPTVLAQLAKRGKRVRKIHWRFGTVTDKPDRADGTVGPG